ncbi:MAG TPA: ROK family transcriptional regulator [Gemmatimonadaceae bacterium]|nr:ROK family transcriptional regulator [Gemmatimonadota bacterium]HNV76376.1 ROK family transcriptional regulator [Gemmatimonadaceae bacterium]HPV77827.1 ROK family transcriptional regulator [Gemmatimonadaceae bacterium]
MLDEPWKSKVTGVVQPEVAPWRADVTRPPSLADSVLRLIWDERAISRADIARRTGLSRSTVSEVVTELLATRLVDEAGEGASSGGRRPIVLEFQDDACVILGVDMGATHVSVALTDLRGRVLAWENRPFPVRSDPEGTRALIAEFCAECLRSWGGDPARLVGIGIAVPCPVDPRHQGRFSTHVLPAWKGRAGFEALGARFGAPIFIDNDANLGAVAERWWGAGRGFDDFTYIKVATGVGAGHMVGGRIARGASGVAGEIGHMAIDLSGDPCDCGNRGCLQTFVGASSLVKRARQLLPEYPTSVLHQGALTIDAIENAALADDPLAIHVISTAADYLGIAVAGVLNLMNPGAVIIGGGIARLGERLLVPLRETVLRRTFVSSVAASEIMTSALGPRSIAIGAATIVLEAALGDPRLFPTIGAR